MLIAEAVIGIRAEILADLPVVGAVLLACRLPLARIAGVFILGMGLILLLEGRVGYSAAAAIGAGGRREASSRRLRCWALPLRSPGRPALVPCWEPS